MEVSAFKFGDLIWEDEFDLVNKLGIILSREGNDTPSLDEISDGYNRMTANESEIDSKE